MPFSSVLNRAYLFILILKNIMCIYIYIYKLLIEKKNKCTNDTCTHNLWWLQSSEVVNIEQNNIYKVPFWKDFRKEDLNVKGHLLPLLPLSVLVCETAQKNWQFYLSILFVIPHNGRGGWWGKNIINNVLEKGAN